MMNRRVVITGIGIVAPGALGVKEFWESIKDGRILYKEMPEEIKRSLHIYMGGKIDYEFPKGRFRERFLKQCDNFSIYALHAAGEAIKDASLTSCPCEREKMGIYVGNSAGGWKSAEKGLHTLHSEGVKKISPYLASNWFPAAPQGHISIFFGLKGPSKTVTADMASSAVAIGNAYKWIKNGRTDIMLAGGTENIIVPWGLMFYMRSGMLNQKSDEEGRFTPFCGKDNGLVIAEGAAFLLLEERERAKKRGAKIYGEIVGYGLTNTGNDTSSAQYKRCLLQSVKEDCPDVIYLNGTGIKKEDEFEICGLTDTFHQQIANITFSCPKMLYGHAYGAATAMDAVTACCSMEEGVVAGPMQGKKNGNTTELCSCSERVVYKNINSCLLTARGAGGINVGIYLRKDTDMEEETDETDRK